MTVRVGHIGFLNCYPLYHGLEQRGIVGGPQPLNVSGKPGTPGAPEILRPRGTPAIELLPGVPTELNRWLVEGNIDLGPISSIAYARNHRRLLLSRRLSISSQGAVDSIQLVSGKPLEEIASVALTGQSATAVALLKTILKLRFGQEVLYGELTGSIPEALRDYDAALLIGDQGLEALYFPQPQTTCHDLGALWQGWTGLPMVYAVWAAREDFARTNGAELMAVEEELVRCMDYGREHLDQVVDSAVGRFRFDRASLTRYFEVLRYDFTEQYRTGLRRFYELAKEAGELEEVPELRFIDAVAGGAASGEAAGPPAAVGAAPGVAGTVDAPQAAGAADEVAGVAGTARVAGPGEAAP